MTFLDRLGSWLQARLTREPRTPEDRRVAPAGRTVAGVVVTPDTALQNAVVWACVRYLSQTVAVLPWHVMKPLASGRGAERMLSHPTDYVLSRRPNPECRPFQFRETLMKWALLWGNGCAEIERDFAGRVVALWPLHPERVSVKRGQEGALYYEVSNEQQAPTVLAPADVFHIRGMGDGPVGLSVVDYAAQSLGWARATVLFGASYFGEGMNPAGVVTVKSGLKTDGFARLRKELESLYKGPRKGNRTAILDNDMTWTKMSATPDESQFIETMQHQVEEICRWFGVPPHKVSHLLRATFSNIEHQAIEVVVDSITPWVKRFEEEADDKLFGQNRSGFYTKMNMNALLRGDFKARTEGYQVLRNIGALSVNDILALEDMNPLPKAAGGDLRVMQEQYVPLDMLGAAQQAKIDAAKKSAEAPAPVAEPEEPEGEVDARVEIGAMLAQEVAHVE